MIQAKEKVALKGVYTITKRQLETPDQYALNEEIEALHAELRNSDDLSEEEESRLQDEISEKVEELNDSCRIVGRDVVDNIIPTVGRTMIANNLTNVSPTNVMYIKYAELGTGATAPANGNTALQTSSYRNAIASRTNASNVGYATAFFGATECSGTYAEAGIFSDGTASAGTGILVSRVAISVTKSASQTLTIDWSLTIS